GLPNRSLFGDRLGQALAMARREGGCVAVLCLDLDRFKEVNDTLGHAAGDLLLRTVAARLRHCLRVSAAQADRTAACADEEPRLRARAGAWPTRHRCCLPAARFGS
ncbi:MAG: diguanylate cyclase domain-containing protein, partial [Rhodopila sp.]